VTRRFGKRKRGREREGKVGGGSERHYVGKGRAKKQYAECLKRSFATSKAYIHLFRGHV
jgi:hypothetical protein